MLTLERCRFGGVIPTPALHRIANNGRRSTTFQFDGAVVRRRGAAMITGRNYHSAAFGVVAEQTTGFPGYDSIITRDKAPKHLSTNLLMGS